MTWPCCYGLIGGINRGVGVLVIVMCVLCGVNLLMLSVFWCCEGLYCVIGGWLMLLG